MNISQDKAEINKYLMQYSWDKMFTQATADSIQLCRYEAGEFIFRAGVKREWFFLYVEGRSKVYRVMENGEIMLVRFYKPFQLLGDLELFLESHSISSVKAISEVCCLRLPVALVKEEMKHNIPLLNHLARGLAAKLASFNTTAAVNQHYTMDIRLAAYLSMIYLEGDYYKESRDEMETENLSEMADFLGCSYRHLTRTLESFKKDGLIEKRGHKIKIIDPEALKKRSRDILLYED